MSLNAFAAAARLRIFEDLRAGRDPAEGEFDAGLLAECRTKGEPQLGITRYEPNAIFTEFIYPGRGGASLVLPVRIAAPERIVFLPVPKWVVENIWQGDVDGSFHFESDARELVEGFQSELEPDKNAAWFGKRQATRRE